jgi:hypothetical protein
VADNPSLTMTADGPTVNHDSWMATDTPMHAMRRAELRTTAPASITHLLRYSWTTPLEGGWEGN